MGKIENLKDAFEGIEIEGFKPDEKETPPETKPETKPPAESKKRGFQPAQETHTGPGEDVLPVDADELFSMAEKKFTESTKAFSAKRENSDPGEAKSEVQVSEIMSPETAELTADMYVMILDAIWAGVCQWFSGVDTDYSFEKRLREKYEKVTAVYFKAQNVQLTPSHFFLLMTALVMFGSGWKAFKDRKKRITAASFAKKSRATNEQRKPGDQTTLFDTEPIVRQRQNFAVVEDGKEMYYAKHPITGEYAKKAERELVPPELQTFIPDFKERTGKWPGKKEVDTFLKSE